MKTLTKTQMQEKAMELRAYKREARSAARDLLYDIQFPHVYEDIDKAKDIGEVVRIMATCREAS